MKARARLVALRVRAVLARALAHAVMRVLPPHAQSLVAGLPDSEENSLVTAIALARRTRGRVLLVANDPAHAREQLDRVAEVLDAASPEARQSAVVGGRTAREAADVVVVVPKKGVATFLEFLRSAVVAYTHGLYDSPRPAGRRLHVNLWHGSGPKWNANAKQSVRVGADLLAANNEPWGRETARALAMPPGTRILPGNPRQDVMLAAATAPRATTREALARLGLDPDAPVLLWMPTFRTSARAGRVGLREGQPFGEMSDPVLEAIAARCSATGVQLVLKTHRHDDDDYTRLGAHVLTTEDVLDAGLTLYELIGLADAMLSDYSSVWVDFLATGRTVALHCPDLAEYERERGLNAPPLREVAGGLLLTSPDDAVELVADVAARRVFRSGELAATRSALGVTLPGPGGRTLADALLDELAALATERFGANAFFAPQRSARTSS